AGDTSLVKHAGDVAGSAPAHVRRRLVRQEILAWGREDVDHLRVLGEPRLVLDAARDHPGVAGPAGLLLVAQSELHPPFDDPEELLVRVLVRCGVRARLHGPPDDHLLVAGEHAARDPVGDLLLGEVLEGVEAFQAGHRAPPLVWWPT